MRNLAFLVAVAAAAVFLAAPLSNASMSPQEKRSLHDRHVIRFFINHPKLASTPAGIRAMLRVLANQQIQIRSLQDARSAKAALPAHDSLWECLRPHEGSDPANRDTGGNGHYGGLQMHPGWGYGTSYYASDDPWIVQKQAAERGYAASGYSRSWLVSQWGQTIGYCWAYV